LLIGFSKLDTFNIKISKIHRDYTQIMFEGVYVKLSQIWKNNYSGKLDHDTIYIFECFGMCTWWYKLVVISDAHTNVVYLNVHDLLPYNLKRWNIVAHFYWLNMQFAFTTLIVHLFDKIVESIWLTFCTFYSNSKFLYITQIQYLFFVTMLKYEIFTIIKMTRWVISKQT
jgi:hypothetical protein